MATRNRTAPAVAQPVDPSPDIQRTIAAALELVETTQRALQPNEQRASEYSAPEDANSQLLSGDTSASVQGLQPDPHWRIARKSLYADVMLAL
jgi:hypothetical protein